MTDPQQASGDGGAWRVLIRQDAPCQISGFYAVGPLNQPPVAYVFGQDEARRVAAAPDLAEALDPEILEAIADEIGSEFKHSARAASLRGIAKRQRAALSKAREGGGS